MSDSGPAFRIGQGFDVHQFGEGDHVMLGGVRILHSRGLVAHSDGDVVIHALCDALLGALALGDIGQMFPDTDARWQGADSLSLLGRVMEHVLAGGWRPGNVDITVMAQAPRLSPHVEAMRTALAGPLDLAVGQVSVKATTTEQLGFIGRGEGIAASAVVLLRKQ